MLRDEKAASIVDRTKRFRYENFMGMATGNMPGMANIVRINPGKTTRIFKN
jgi:hypothetical protein